MAVMVYPTSVTDTWMIKNKPWVVLAWVKGGSKSYRIHTSTEAARCNLKQLATAHPEETHWGQHWVHWPCSSKTLARSLLTHVSVSFFFFFFFKQEMTILITVVNHLCKILQMCRWKIFTLYILLILIIKQSSLSCHWFTTKIKKKKNHFWEWGEADSSRLNCWCNMDDTLQITNSET